MNDTILGMIETSEWKAVLWRGKGWVVEHTNPGRAAALEFALNFRFPSNARPEYSLVKLDSRDPVGWALRHAAKHYNANMQRAQAGH